MKQNIAGRIAVAPLPVLIVGSYDEAGVPDAMNAAWGGQCGYNEVALNLSSNHKTTENIRKSKAFTVSIGTVATMNVCDYVGMNSGHKGDKLKAAGIASAKSAFVNAPVLEAFPLTLECEAISIKDEFGETRIVGKVVNMLADTTILNAEGHIDYDRLRPISFDSESNSYRELGPVVGKAFHDGAALDKK